MIVVKASTVGARICETRSQLGVHFGGVNVNDEV